LISRIFDNVSSPDSETEHFFLALKMLGTDFTLMAMMFPGRNREELRRKFVKETKKNQNLLEDILNNKVPVDEEKLRGIRSN